MTILDWAIIAAVLMSMALAAAHGFVFEVFSLAGVVVGYLAAAWEYPRLAAWYMQFAKSNWIANVAGFLTIFLAVLLLAGAIAKLARAGVQGVGLRWFDRALGALFGLLRGALLVTVVLVAAGAWSPDAPWLASSRLAPYLLVVGRAAVWAAPGSVRAQFDEGMQHLKELRARANTSTGHM